MTPVKQPLPNQHTHPLLGGVPVGRGGFVSRATNDPASTDSTIFNSTISKDWFYA
jgi:hypothetical protein